MLHRVQVTDTSQHHLFRGDCVNQAAWSMEEEVWWCFSGDTVSHLFRIQGTLNQHGYHSILQQYAIPSGLRLVGLSFVFQQDDDPTHTSRLCKGYLTKKESDGVLHQMTWPLQSPTSTQFLRWFGMSWRAERRKSSQQVLIIRELL